jgi:hypothetical protein
MRLFLSLWDNLPHHGHLYQQNHHQYIPLLHGRMLHSNETFLTQYSNDTTTTSNTNTGPSNNGSSNHSFEFVAFLVWYLVLVGCCIIPTCCSYRRRRLAEQRYLLHQANLHRMQQNGLFVLSNFHYRTSEDGSPYIVRRYNSERIQQERVRILTEELQDTTVVSAIELRLCHSGKALLLLHQTLREFEADQAMPCFAFLDNQKGTS